MRQLPILSPLAASACLAGFAYVEHPELEDGTLAGKQQSDATAVTIAEESQ